MWEEARECGACGCADWRPAGSIQGKRYAACVRCGVVRLYDRVAPEHLHQLYAGYYPDADPSPEELDRQLANPTFAQRRRRLEAAVPADRRRIFEIGCGDGNFLALLARAGWRVHGSEIDDRTAAIIHRRHGIRAFVGDVVEAVPPGVPFPAVAAYHVLEHVYQPREWLRAVRAMLHARAVVHLQVPNHASLTRRLTGAAWASMVFPQHVYFYTPATLAALLAREGFRPESVTTWDPWHGPGTVAASAVNQARRMAGHGLPWSAPVTNERTERAPGRPLGRVSLSRRIVDAVSRPVARMEAALGMGAVVDVVARRR